MYLITRNTWSSYVVWDFMNPNITFKFERVRVCMYVWKYICVCVCVFYYIIYIRTYIFGILHSTTNLSAPWYLAYDWINDATYSTYACSYTHVYSYIHIYVYNQCPKPSNVSYVNKQIRSIGMTNTKQRRTLCENKQNKKKKENK